MKDPESGEPMPAPDDKPGLAERYVRWVENRPRRRAVGFLGAGVVMLLLGGLIWLHFTTLAHECSSGLVYALDESQCSSATTWHTIGGIGALTGIVLLIVGLVRR